MGSRFSICVELFFSYGMGVFSAGGNSGLLSSPEVVGVMVGVAVTWSFGGEGGGGLGCGLRHAVGGIDQINHFAEYP